MLGQLDLFRALADPTRLRIVHLLREMELAVGEVALVVGQSQPRVSRHVRILVEAGLAERRKEGSWVFLRLCGGQETPALLALLDAAAPSASERLWIEADQARLTAVRAERARAAEDYFASHAEEWDAQRSLYVPEADVEAAMLAMLKTHKLGRLLDVGTGTGRIATLFAAQSEQVLAIDRSAEMLRLARGKLPRDIADRVHFLAGDFSALPIEDGSADTAILHQVLHYAQAPERVIAEIARTLRPGGRLLIVDFAPHEREELRTRDAHSRLGFSDEQIRAWFAAAGVALEQVETLAGGELTVKLWLGQSQRVPLAPKKDARRA
ncbi:MULTISPECIES: ArsR/SmtB family transcription factor [Sphingobium]|uniref:ArsR/SmtB family transcription factor n=1 Tax=Sphingobium TaxID=165695 RepID=UPI0015EB534D|nr:MULTISPECIES: metalloregulator ArsR/SmtB family transcription factor [Sphingobium]MCW2364264.1 ArsR family transcriptional regulator [Sphingobium sp. B10D3B]MCW2402339.1 ArsR family transcriptional regulator [Sphingobium sp. B10D7B]MCW2409318.1 ArsR family transcriptional regulator [Sphingobium xanthum]